MILSFDLFAHIEQVSLFLLLMEKRLNTHGQRQITSEHTQGHSQHILLVEVVQSRSDSYLYSFFFYERVMKWKISRCPDNRRRV